MDALVRRAGSEPWGVRELAAELSESRSTVNRILVSLVENGFAIEVGIGKYSLGPRVSVLTKALSDASLLLGLSGASLSELADSSQCTALVSVYCPLSNGYFVAACREAKATLTFRPELGVIFPLTFGDIGRQFSAFIEADCSHSNVLGNPRDVSCSSRAQEALGLLSEAEFPSALSIATKSLANGLIISISVHSVASTGSKKSSQIDADVQRVAAEIEAAVKSKILNCPQRAPNLSIEDTKSTVTRLERLLLLACAFPDGLKNSVNLTEQLLCNEATAKRLIQSGVQGGVVDLSGSTLFPGSKLYQWASRIGRDHRNLADLTRPILSGLVQETGETIAFLAYDESTKKAEFLDVIQGWRPIQYKLQVNVEVPLYAGAAGKAVLAFCDQKLVDSIELEKITEATITSREVLRSELKVIHERGWATGDGERVLGAFGLAVPFFVDGKIRGSISATIPQYRKDERDLPTLTQLMREATAKIERLLSLGVSRG
ncbi:MAG: IclR family transcriptional regulator domain-containing protein [Pseudomonas sp.]|uniref:IclR family transcriptional regulator domain-containing protein n=1 Tax=Pseudomonas sp. TaxID=306 RepID=UPI003D6DE6FB